MSQNGQTHFKNLAANAARFLVSDHFGKLCIKGLKYLVFPTKDIECRSSLL